MATTDSNDLAVRVRDLSVTFRVYAEQRLTMGQLVGRGLRSRRHVEVNALRGIDLDVRIGEAVGVIGSNGSGKSTLLRSIAGLQSKTSGTVEVRGDAHLLGVSAALKPRLSGHRNVLLGGLAMGIPRSEIDAVIPDVAEFADIGEALDRSMETYSSGMRARLAFAIATLRIPDVLLIDEALAVGDRSFREKSLQRINDIRDAAGTVLMVTHNLNEVRETCDRAIWLDQGLVVADGPTEQIIEQYEASTSA